MQECCAIMQVMKFIMTIWKYDLDDRWAMQKHLDIIKCLSFMYHYVLMLNIPDAIL